MEVVAALTFMGVCLLLPMVLSSFIRCDLPSHTFIQYNYYNYEDNRKVIKQLPRKKNRQLPKEDEQSQEENTIFGECVSSLMSLGVKKSEAIAKVKSLFKNKEYESVEDFLMDAYKDNQKQ